MSITLSEMISEGFLLNAELPKLIFIYHFHLFVKSKFKLKKKIKKKKKVEL